MEEALLDIQEHYYEHFLQGFIVKKTKANTFDIFGKNKNKFPRNSLKNV